MTDAISELAEIFDGEGAFIFVHRQGGLCPLFKVVTAKDIKDFNCPHARRHVNGVLLAMEHMCSNDGELARIVQTLANDCDITTVYAESVLLGEDLASQARSLWEAVSHKERSFGVEEKI
ncbi:hypothetical protein BD769DRAFT_1389597 [Suillus cothurnatus]|nr:hypothetical protein BD769DRAFT_1389597 [Suillus cothurnatus]